MGPRRVSKTLRFSGLSLAGNIQYCVESEIFCVGDYRWRIHFYPNGRSILNKNSGYVSIFLKLESEKCLVEVSLICALVDPSGANSPHLLKGPDPTVLNSFEIKTSGSDCRGYRYLIERKKLEEHPYFKDDSFTMECTIDILKDLRMDVVRDTPSTCTDAGNILDLQKDLVSLLDSTLGADVSFKVGTTTFNVHRCILAARSAVFRAQLFGPLKDSYDDGRIVIHDMEAPVFREILHFMYSDMQSYPEIEDSVPMTQHLLVAADRYELERLRQICEDGLMKSIDVATVATTLALAEQHGCMQLKEACLKFMASSPRILDAVTLTEGFQHLCQSCPYIVKHLSSKAELQGKSV